MRGCGDGLYGLRARGLIVVLWRAGLRIQEALDLTELDLDARRGSVLVRRGKGGHRARSAWTTVASRTWSRGEGPRVHAGRPAVLRDRRPHQLRRAHALELAHEGVPLNVIRRQLGHCNLGVISIYLQGIDPNELIETIHGRRQPMIRAGAGLVLPSRRRVRPWPAARARRS